MDNFFDNFDFDDENFDPEIYKEYLKNIYESLTGKELTDEEIENMDIKDSKSAFIQSLEDDNYVEDYIIDNDMECEITFEDTDYGIMIKENWKSEENSIELNRLYPYSHRTISSFDNDRQKIIYEAILEEFLKIENYEEAAIVRDKLNEL